MAKTKTLTKTTKKKLPAVSAMIVTASVLNDVNSFENEAMPIIRKLEKLTIKEQTQYDKAGLYVKQLKELRKGASVKEKEIIDPLEKSKKATKALFAPFYELVDNAEAVTKQGMLEFNAKQKKLAEKVNNDFKKGKIKKISTWSDKVKATQVSSSTSSVRKLKRLEIFKESKIPREFLVPDRQAIEQHIKEGGTVPGCKLIEVDSIAI